MNRDLLQKFKKSPGLENPLLNFTGLKRKTTQSSPLAQRKALGGKIQKTTLMKTFNKIRIDESSVWVLWGKQKDHQVFCTEGI